MNACILLPAQSGDTVKHLFGCDLHAAAQRTGQPRRQRIRAIVAGLLRAGTRRAGIQRGKPSRRAAHGRSCHVRGHASHSTHNITGHAQCAGLALLLLVHPGQPSALLNAQRAAHRLVSADNVAFAVGPLHAHRAVWACIPQLCLLVRGQAVPAVLSALTGRPHLVFPVCLVLFLRQLSRILSVRRIVDARDQLPRALVVVDQVAAHIGKSAHRAGSGALDKVGQCAVFLILLLFGSFAAVLPGSPSVGAAAHHLLHCRLPGRLGRAFLSGQVQNTRAAKPQCLRISGHTAGNAQPVVIGLFPQRLGRVCKLALCSPRLQPFPEIPAVLSAAAQRLAHLLPLLCPQPVYCRRAGHAFIHNRTVADPCRAVVAPPPAFDLFILAQFPAVLRPGVYRHVCGRGMYLGPLVLDLAAACHLWPP